MSLNMCVGRDLSVDSKNIMDESGMGERSKVLEIRTRSETGRKSCGYKNCERLAKTISKKCFKSSGTYHNKCSKGRGMVMENIKAEGFRRLLILILRYWSI